MSTISSSLDRASLAASGADAAAQPEPQALDSKAMLQQFFAHAGALRIPAAQDLGQGQGQPLTREALDQLPQGLPAEHMGRVVHFPTSPMSDGSSIMSDARSDASSVKSGFTDATSLGSDSPIKAASPKDFAAAAGVDESKLGQQCDADAEAAASTTDDSATDDKTNTPPADGRPKPDDVRPKGDTRSADDIINGSPTFKNMGNQEKIKDNLKKNCGDWTDPKLTPDQRADAAYRANEVIKYVKSSAAYDGTGRSSDVTDDGRIDGFTSSGDARHGTEAGMLKDFGEKGYGALPESHCLDTTTDPHVKKDGTTIEGAAYIAKAIGDVFLKIISTVEHIASQVLGVLADLKIPGISQLAAAASVGAEAIAGAADIGKTALDGGDVAEAAKQAAIGIGEQAISTLTAPGVGKAIGKGIETGVEAGVNAGKAAGKAGAKEGEAVAAKAGEAAAPALSADTRNELLKEGGKAAGSEVAGDLYNQYSPVKI